MSYRRLTPLVLLVALLAALVAPVSAAPVLPSAPSATAPERAVERLGACLAARGTGDLLFLIDQSGSLRSSDPDGVRVRAASYLLAQLAESTRTGTTELQVALAGFDADYQRTSEWRPLSSDALPELDGAVREYADRNTGVETDYVNALAGARDELRARARGDTGRCQAVLWFTDGMFDLVPRENADQRQRFGASKPYAPNVQLTDEAAATRAEEVGRKELCRVGGVADQLRAAGVITLAVGLGKQKDDFAFMQGVATGTAGQDCGRTPTDAVGDFRLATDVDDLIFALDALGDPGRPVSPVPSEVCGSQICDEARRFVLDRSISAVHILTGSDQPGIDVVLIPPDGSTPLRFRQSQPATPEQTLAGQQVRANWLSDRTLDLSLRQSTPTGWTGQWSVVFVDPASSRPQATARTQIRITGDLIPALADGTKELRSGDRGEFRLGLASESTDKAVPFDQVLGTLAMSASLVTADGKELVLASNAGPADLTAPLAVDLKDIAPGDASLRLSLAVTTAAVAAGPNRQAVPGTELAERTVEVPIVVLPPLNFPTVDSAVDLGRVEGDGPLRGSLTVTGPGCVWLDGGKIDAAPEGIGAAVVGAEQAKTSGSCLRVPGGQSNELPVVLSYESPGNGTVAGTIVAHLAPEGALDRELATPVSFIGDVVKPADEATRWLVFAIALGLGLLLPLLFLYLARWRSARLPGIALKVGAIDVSVAKDVLRDGLPLTVRAQDLQFLSVPPGGTRSLSPVPGVQLQTRTSLLPTDPGWTQVSAQGFLVTTSSGRDRLPLAVQGSWVALFAAPDLQQIRLLVLLSAQAGDQDLARIVEGVRRDLPSAATRLRQAAIDAGTVPPPASVVAAGLDPSPPPSQPGGAASPPPSGSTPPPPPGSSGGLWP